MNLTMQVAVVVAVFLCVVEGAPDGRLVRSKQQRPTRGFKNVEMMTARGFGKRAQTRNERDVAQQTASERTNRGTPTFKSPSVGIARDFGKRTPELEPEGSEDVPEHKTFRHKGPLRFAIDFGKRGDSEISEEVYGLDNFWDNLEAIQEKENQDGNEDKAVESIPVEWFINEMVNNPDFIRSVVRKFIDINQDGLLSADELLRNVA